MIHIVLPFLHTAEAGHQRGRHLILRDARNCPIWVSLSNLKTWEKKITILKFSSKRRVPIFHFYSERTWNELAIVYGCWRHHTGISSPESQPVLNTCTKSMTFRTIFKQTTKTTVLCCWCIIAWSIRSLLTHNFFS